MKYPNTINNILQEAKHYSLLLPTHQFISRKGLDQTYLSINNSWEGHKDWKPVNTAQLMELMDRAIDEALNNDAELHIYICPDNQNLDIEDLRNLHDDEIAEPSWTSQSYEEHIPKLITINYYKD